MGARFHDTARADKGEAVNQLDDLVEEVWRDLGGRVSRARIRQVAAGVEAGFRGAPVTVFVPLFIRRLTRERLQKRIGSGEVGG